MLITLTKHTSLTREELRAIVHALHEEHMGRINEPDNSNQHSITFYELGELIKRLDKVLNAPVDPDLIGDPGFVLGLKG